MQVKARFYVQSVELWPGGSGGKVKMQPVTRGARNASWSAATPSGSIEMTITNPSAFEVFAAAVRDGSQPPEFELTFEAVPVPKLDDGHAFEKSPQSHYAGAACALCSVGEFDNDGKPTHKS